MEKEPKLSNLKIGIIEDTIVPYGSGIISYGLFLDLKEIRYRRGNMLQIQGLSED